MDPGLRSVAPSRPRHLLKLLWLVAVAALIGLLVRHGYQVSWTGLPAHAGPSGELVPAKTLWDWLDLLIVPLFLAMAAYILEGSRKRSDQRVERDRQRQEVLEGYFACLTDFILERS